MNTLDPADSEGKLPPVLVVSKFTAARGKEIQIMKTTLSATSGTKLAFQKLPRHMRRRAMSHNSKRLPRRLREIHLNQMKKSGLLSEQKNKSSRKYRRRPYNLVNDYARRRKRIKWLETHLWHAKRFHMIEKWGYKLPFSPCDKTFRACYRATVNHCLLQDISYYRCIEVIGNYDCIVDNFKKFSDPNLGLPISAKAYAGGSREGSITIFRIDGNKKAIGTIYFNWKPVPVQDKRVLWIWIHAAYYTETLNTLKCCFNVKLNSGDIDFSTEGQVYTNLDSIELRELNLKRFRLTGPLSNSVLQNCFQVAKNVENILEWTTGYNGDIREQIKIQNKYWTDIKNISSTTQLSPHMILSLVIEDPRFNFPKKRTKSTPDSKLFEFDDVLSDKLAEGPIWNYNIRKTVSETKPSNAALSELRRKLLVPGSDLDEKGVPVPIMLIQRPGRQTKENLGYNSGWDVIIPSGWAQSIWISLIMWGARPGGLKETNFINFEMNMPTILYPDTQAGLEEEFSISNKQKEIYFKLPPNKRTNYNKFRIASPFQWNWNLLLSDWAENRDDVKDFFIMRDKKQLKHIQDLLSSKSKNIEIPNLFCNCLVPVSIKFPKKGLCKKFAIICLPQEGDMKNIPTEEKCIDKNEKLRKELRSNHKTLLKKLRRRRIRAKQNGKAIPIDMDMLKNYSHQMKELWIPEATNIRYSCSREVIGFVRDGDFSLLLGQSKAIGYIAMSALKVLMCLKSRKHVLVRNTNSKQYRLGILEILI